MLFKKHTTKANDDGSLTLEFEAGQGLELPAKVENGISEISIDEGFSSMSDAAIDAANANEQDNPEPAKPFRYKPTDSTSLVLAKATSNSGLTNNDIVTIALLLLQDASQVEVQRAVTAILQEKSQLLFNSLK